ncbi:XRE family transcriptional regulator [Streptomyces lavendulae]|nr:helix-turn-helix transcriptional regulator [Streptomyces lavendulae]TXJ78596.1 XRE family transcriptional regulator [Streptomyces lavendulae]
MPELYQRLDTQRQKQGLTWRQLAAITDLSSSTFSRIADGNRPDADALVTLLVWLDLDTDLAIMIKPEDQP